MRLLDKLIGKNIAPAKGIEIRYTTKGGGSIALCLFEEKGTLFAYCPFDIEPARVLARDILKTCRQIEKERGEG